MPMHWWPQSKRYATPSSTSTRVAIGSSVIGAHRGPASPSGSGTRRAGVAGMGTGQNTPRPSVAEGLCGVRTGGPAVARRSPLSMDGVGSVGDRGVSFRDVTISLTCASACRWQPVSACVPATAPWGDRRHSVLPSKA